MKNSRANQRGNNSIIKNIFGSNSDVSQLANSESSTHLPETTSMPPVVKVNKSHILMQSNTYDEKQSAALRKN